MTDHVLLKHATRRPFREFPELPEGAAYDTSAGVWMLDGEPLVRSVRPGGPFQSTKKCDQETGEDQKGE